MGFQGTRMEAVMDKYKNAPMMMLLCKHSEETSGRKRKERTPKNRTSP